MAAFLVAEALADLQRLQIPALGSGEVLLLLGEHSELVIGRGSSGLAGELFRGPQGLLVPLLGGGEVPLLLGDQPLTGNGKVDRGALERGGAEDGEPGGPLPAGPAACGRCWCVSVTASTRCSPSCITS